MSVAQFWHPFALEPFLNALLIGLSIGSIWLLAALGLAVIYGTMGVINMAHGEFIMLGAYATFVLSTYLGFNVLICLPAAFVIVGAIGWVMERTLIRYLYHRPLDTLLATAGVSLVLIQGVRLIFGGEPQYIPLPPWVSPVMDVGFFHIAWLRIYIMIVTFGLMILTWFIMYRTNWGIQVRAVAQNKEVASACGVNADLIYGLTFALGAGLAGVAGTLFSAFKNVFPDMGADYIIEAFLVVVVGGVGTLLGSAVSAGMLGQLSSIFSYFTNDTFAKFVLFTLVVVFLRFRPQGLFAESAARR
jgi:urea transport system permease protein